MPSQTMGMGLGGRSEGSNKFQGKWDPSTNTPTLTNNDLTKANYIYVVSVAATRFSIAWEVGDWLNYDALGNIVRIDNPDFVTSVNTRTGAITLTASDINLGNVDNTSDANKPVSSATQTALDGKQSLGDYATNTALNNGLAAKENSITAGTTSQFYRGDKSFQTLDKTAVGLANVNNTSDANKPISTATQTALDAKLTNPLTTRGDILYQNASITTRLPIGTTGRILASDGTDASWQYPQNQNTTLIMRQLMGSPIIAETVPLNISNTSTGLASGTIYYEIIYVPYPTLVTGAIYSLIQAGVFVGNNTNGIALYSYSAGTLTKLVETSNNQAIWKTGNLNQTPFTSTITLNKGIYYLAFVFSASSSTTVPSLRSTAGSLTNMGETNNSKLYGFRNAQTVLPTTEVMSNISTATTLYHMGLY